MFATDWKRAFKIHSQFIKWLNAFGIINEIASTKILKKFMKNHFEMKDNLIDKMINVHIRQYQFVQRRNIRAITMDIESVYADNFTNGDTNKAKQILRGGKFIVSDTDFTIVTFFGSSSLFMLLMIVYFCIIEDPIAYESDQFRSAIKAFTPIKRVTFIIIFILMATGVIIRVFREQEINYLHIFELSY